MHEHGRGARSTEGESFAIRKGGERPGRDYISSRKGELVDKLRR